MFSRAFWIATLERAVKTFAQALAAALAADGVNLLHVGWLQALITALFAALLSLCTSVASVDLGPGGTPSLVTEPSALGPIAQARQALAELKAQRARRT